MVEANQAAKNKRAGFKKAGIEASSFYQRNNPTNLVANLQAEIEEQYNHEVTMCDYFIRGKDHLDQKTINQYSIVKELGQGSFGTVYRVHVNETHEDFAMKVFSKQILLSKKDAMVKDAETGRLKHKNYLEEIRKEIEIMKQLNATNVVRLKEVIDNENEDKLILILDFCAKGEILGWDEGTNKFTPCFRDQEFFEEV